MDPPDGSFAGLQLLQPVGEGAAGRVYAARWLARGGLPVAVKVLHEDVAPGSPQHERFLREGVVRRIESPHVVQVHALEVDPRTATAFLIMEWVRGPSAWERLRGGPLSVPAALRLAHDMAQGLDAAASVGVVHRDVKPGNVLLSAEAGVAKLCDFGLAKDLDETLRSLTRTGVGMGSLSYMAPEQVRDAKRVDARADLYALGACLYHFLAGAPPFRVGSPQELVHLAGTQPPPLHERRPDCPLQAAALAEALLSGDPEDRPAIWDVVDDLEALREPFGPQAGHAELFAPVQ